MRSFIWIILGSSSSLRNKTNYLGMKFYIAAFFILYFSTNCFSNKIDNEKIVAQYEDTLKAIAPAIISGISDSARKSANTRVIQLMEQVLQYGESFTYPFDSLKTIAHLASPDKRFRIYNWILPKMDGTYTYYGYIQQYDKKKKKVIVTVLKDLSDKTEKPEKAILTPDKWYGALYYKILLNKFLGKRYYTLLGWKGYDRKSTKKVIDVVIFNNTKPKFGYAMFKLKKETKSRIIFQYSSQAVMSLRYEDKDKAIVNDHLSPSSDNLKGQYEFYGPDLTYDALKFKRGKWLLTELFLAENNQDPDYKKPRKQPIHAIPIGTKKNVFFHQIKKE